MARRTKADSEQTREQILKAAVRVFYRYGVAKTTLAQIAAEAGVTRGAIYWHFKDKAEVFKALRDKVILLQEEIIANAMAEHREDTLTTLQQVTLDSFAALTKCEERQQVYSILFSKCEYTGEIADMIERQEQAGTALRRSVADAFGQAAGQGLLHPTWRPDVAARAFECLATGLLYEWLRFGRSFDLLSVGGDVLSAFFRSLRNQPRRKRPVEERSGAG